jgi:hypothetical protein
VRRAVVLSWALALPAAAHGQTWTASADQRFFAQSIPRAVFESQLRYPRVADDTADTRAAYQLRLRGGVSGRPTDAVGLVAELDTGLLELASDGVRLDGRPVGEQAARTLLLGPVYAELQVGESGALLVRAGKLRARLGEGALFDAYAIGGLVDLDLGLAYPEHPWQLRVQALLPSGELVQEAFHSPLFGAELAYRFDRRTQVRLHGALYLDRGAAGPVLADAGARGRARRIQALFDANDLPPEGAVCDPSDDDTTRPDLGEAIACAQEALVSGANSGRFDFEGVTRGALGWTGASAEAGGHRWRARALFLYGFGGVDAELHASGALQAEVNARLEALEQRDGPLARAVLRRTRRALGEVLDSAGRVTLGAWLAQATGQVELTEDLRVDAFALALSGDDGLDPLSSTGQRYGAFVSLAPYLAHTSLFFNGGAASVVASPTVTALAPDAAGLASGGVGAELFLGERFRLRGVVAAMAALIPNTDGARFQGVEVDLSGDAILTDWLLVLVDGAVLVPGPYFGDVPLGLQLIASVAARL